MSIEGKDVVTEKEYLVYTDRTFDLYWGNKQTLPTVTFAWYHKGFGSNGVSSPNDGITGIYFISSSAGSTGGDIILFSG